MDEQTQPPAEPSEEELRAAYEEQLKLIRVEDVLVQTVVSLLNLGGRKAGLAPGTEAEKDPEQLRQAIEGVRALLPLVEGALGPEGAQLRQVLSQLQMAYARDAPPGGAAPSGGAPQEGAAPDEGPGPAQSSGRLWVPGQ
jgi:hypothetical protein